jgi:hypothetical protein
MGFELREKIYLRASGSIHVNRKPPDAEEIALDIGR